jgi:hypothetical protein
VIATTTHWQHGAAALLGRAIDLRLNPQLRKSIETWLVTAPPEFHGNPADVAEAWAQWVQKAERSARLRFRPASAELKSKDPHDLAYWILRACAKRRIEQEDAVRNEEIAAKFRGGKPSQSPVPQWLRKLPSEPPDGGPWSRRAKAKWIYQRAGIDHERFSEAGVLKALQRYEKRAKESGR